MLDFGVKQTGQSFLSVHLTSEDNPARDRSLLTLKPVMDLHLTTEKSGHLLDEKGKKSALQRKMISNSQ